MTKTSKWEKNRDVKVPSLDKVIWLKELVGELNLMTNMLKLSTIHN